MVAIVALVAALTVQSMLSAPTSTSVPSSSLNTPIQTVASSLLSTHHQRPEERGEAAKRQISYRPQPWPNHHDSHPWICDILNDICAKRCGPKGIGSPYAINKYYGYLEWKSSLQTNCFEDCMRDEIDKVNLTPPTPTTPAKPSPSQAQKRQYPMPDHPFESVWTAYCKDDCSPEKGLYCATHRIDICIHECWRRMKREHPEGPPAEYRTTTKPW